MRIKFLKLSILSLLLVTPQFALAQGGPQGPTKVEAEAVKMQNVSDNIEALGTARAFETAVITADTAAKVLQLNFEGGEFVEEGAILAELDSKSEKAQLKAVEAMLSEARSSLNRVKSLKSNSYASQSTYDSQIAEVRRLEAEAETLNVALEEMVIRAPFSGVVGLREISVGALVTPGERITTLDKVAQMKLDFDVPSRFLPVLKQGLPLVATAEAYPNRTFSGQIMAINTKVDEITRSIKVRALVDNEDLTLKPGLLMSVELEANPREVITVPEESLTKRGYRNYVMVVSEGEEGLVAEEKEIQLGKRFKGFVEVESGLDKGDKVITHGLIKLRNGASIELIDAENSIIK
jgi:membrane fusion protein (multidrug efflux system)